MTWRTNPGLIWRIFSMASSGTPISLSFDDVPRSSMKLAGTVVYQPIATACRLRMASAFSVIEPKLLVPRSSSFMPDTLSRSSHPSARLVLPRGHDGGHRPGDVRLVVAHLLHVDEGGTWLDKDLDFRELPLHDFGGGRGHGRPASARRARGEHQRDLLLGGAGAGGDECQHGGGT